MEMGGEVVVFCMKTCVLEFSSGLATIFIFCGIRFSIDFVEYFSHNNLLKRLALLNSIVTKKKKKK